MRKKFLKNLEKQHKNYGRECKNIKYLKGNGNGDNDEKNG